MVAPPVGALLAEDPGDALAELVGVGEEDPHALSDGEALGRLVGVPLSEAAPLPLGAVALAEAEGGALPLPASLPLGSGLGVPCAGLTEGVPVTRGDTEALGEGSGQDVAAPLVDGAPVPVETPVALSNGVAEALKLGVAAGLCEGGALPVGGGVAVAPPLGVAVAVPLSLTAQLAETAAADPVGASVFAALSVTDNESAGDDVASAELLCPFVGVRGLLGDAVARGDEEACEAEGQVEADPERDSATVTEGEGELEGQGEPLRERSGGNDAVLHLEPLGVLEGEDDPVPQPLLEREGRALAEARLLREADAVPEGTTVATLDAELDGEAVSAPVAVREALGVPSRGEGDAIADIEA